MYVCMYVCINLVKVGEIYINVNKKYLALESACNTNLNRVKTELKEKNYTIHCVLYIRSSRFAKVLIDGIYIRTFLFSRINLIAWRIFGLKRSISSDDGIDSLISCDVMLNF